jgi:hypothetical protein
VGYITAIGPKQRPTFFKNKIPLLGPPTEWKSRILQKCRARFTASRDHYTNLIVSARVMPCKPYLHKHIQLIRNQPSKLINCHFPISPDFPTRIGLQCLLLIKPSSSSFAGLIPSFFVVFAGYFSGNQGSGPAATLRNLKRAGHGRGASPRNASFPFVELENGTHCADKADIFITSGYLCTQSPEALVSALDRFDHE